MNLVWGETKDTEKKEGKERGGEQLNEKKPFWVLEGNVVSPIVSR